MTNRSSLVGGALARLNLRFPGIFALLLVVTVADILIPDFVPFVDEIVLALLTALFGLWRNRRAAPGSPPPEAPPALPGAER